MFNLFVLFFFFFIVLLSLVCNNSANDRQHYINQHYVTQHYITLDDTKTAYDCQCNEQQQQHLTQYKERDSDEEQCKLDLPVTSDCHSYSDCFLQNSLKKPPLEYTCPVCQCPDDTLPGFQYYTKSVEFAPHKTIGCTVDTTDEKSIGCVPILVEQQHEIQQQEHIEVVDGCTTVDDCAQDRECHFITKLCISPCHICGLEAHCVAHDHIAICSCAPLYIGDAYDKVTGCYQEPLPPLPPTTTTTTTTTTTPTSTTSTSTTTTTTTTTSTTTTTTTETPPPPTETIPPPSEIQVKCVASGVVVNVQIDRFDGVIYVKGYSRDKKCRRIVQSSDANDVIEFHVLFGECGLEHVDGIAQFILIIQKHPKLVTYRARAYRIKCVYNTADKTVTIGYNTSIVSTSGTIANVGPPPTIILTIVTLDGKDLTTAEIGDDLLLTIDVQPDFIYGGFAKNCFAITKEDAETENGTNGPDVKFQVTDMNGCAINRALFGEWDYDVHNKTLKAKFNSFKFPNSNNLRFNCDVKVCFGSCPPINCDGIDAYGRRRKRQAKDVEEDLTLTDEFKEGALREDITVQSNSIQSVEKRSQSHSSLVKPVEQPKVPDIDYVCLDKLSLILSVIFTALLALICATIFIWCWLRAYRQMRHNQNVATKPHPHPQQIPNPLFHTNPGTIVEPSPDYNRR